MTCPSKRSSTSATPTRLAPRPSSSRKAERLSMLQVELVSPEKVLYSGQASFVRARTVGGGEIAFLTGHAPFIGALDICAVKIITDSGTEQLVAVHGGFVEVSDDNVTLLSDVAELAEDIDVGRAE